MPDFLVERVGLARLLRRLPANLRCAAALVEQVSHPQPRSASKQKGDILLFYEKQNVPFLF